MRAFRPCIHLIIAFIQMKKPNPIHKHTGDQRENERGIVRVQEKTGWNYHKFTNRNKEWRVGKQRKKNTYNEIKYRELNWPWWSGLETNTMREYSYEHRQWNSFRIYLLNSVFVLLFFSSYFVLLVSRCRLCVVNTGFLMALNSETSTRDRERESERVEISIALSWDSLAPICNLHLHFANYMQTQSQSPSACVYEQHF